MEKEITIPEGFEATIDGNKIILKKIESEDERIRKQIKAFIKSRGSQITQSKTDSWLAWLEKQGEQKPYGQRKKCFDCQFNYAGECKGSCAMKSKVSRSLLLK